jgi:hypothetical protein
MSEKENLEPPKTLEYVPKNRCNTESCTNRKVVDLYCLSCYYSINKPLPKKKKGAKDEHDVSG